MPSVILIEFACKRRLRGRLHLAIERCLHAQSSGVGLATKAFENVGADLLSDVEGREFDLPTIYLGSNRGSPSFIKCALGDRSLFQHASKYEVSSCKRSRWPVDGVACLRCFRDASEHGRLS